MRGIRIKQTDKGLSEKHDKAISFAVNIYKTIELQTSVFVNVSDNFIGMICSQ